MNDRELMDLAAKAAGISGGWGDVVTVVGETIDMTDIWFRDDPTTCPIWDPINDDGDALRLAVNLKMDLKIGTYDAIADGHVNVVLGYAVERIEANAASSIRRAIVRAAADIGKTMLTNETTQEKPQ